MIIKTCPLFFNRDTFLLPFLTENIPKVKSGSIEIQATLQWVLNGIIKTYINSKTSSASVNLVYTLHVIHIRKVSVNIK